MARKYFVYKGLQFETLDIPSNTFTGFSTLDSIEAVDLESVVTALGTDIISGANTAAQVTTIRGMWSESVTNQYQRFARQVLNEQATLITNAVVDATDNLITGNFHNLSHTWILPSAFSEGMNELPDATGDAEAARSRMVVEVISIRHDNIAKHATSAQAWQAYIGSTFAAEGSEAKMVADRAYYKNPPTPSGD